MLALIVYLPFQSASLDDLDSYNFAGALLRFDPANGTPHPPGYVLYVWLGRLVFALIGERRAALTVLSALSAALACGLLFALGHVLFNARIGLYAFLLVLLTSVMWLNANKALSDAPGLLMQAVCILCLALAVRRRMPLWIAGLCLGLAAGFRPQGVMGLAAALLLAAIWLRAKPNAWLATGLAVGLSMLTWLLPLLAAFGWSIPSLRTYFAGATSFVTGQESLFATTLSTQSVAARWRDLWFWSSQAVFAPLAGWLRAVLFAGTLTLACAGCVRQRKNIGMWLCLAWMLPQTIAHLLFLYTAHTRYLLAFLFPAALLIAAGLDALPYRRLGLSIALAFALIVGTKALPLAQGLHTIPSPPTQLAAFIAGRLPQDQTVIVARQSYNALEYHLPGWDVRFEEYFGVPALEQEFAQGKTTYIVIVDPESLRPDEQYVEIETRAFARDPQIHAKHAQVEVNIYGRVDSLSLRDFALPESGTIPIGTPQDAKYLLGGWYRREEIGGVVGRWTGAEISATLRVFLPQPVKTLSIRAWSFAPEQIVEVLCNDQRIDSMAVPQAWTDVTVELPVWCARPDGLTYIALHPRVLLSPSSDGQSTDHRTLGVAVAEIRFGP